MSPIGPPSDDSLSGAGNEPVGVKHEPGDESTIPLEQTIIHTPAEDVDSAISGIISHGSEDGSPACSSEFAATMVSSGNPNESDSGIGQPRRGLSDNSFEVNNLPSGGDFLSTGDQTLAAPSDDDNHPFSQHEEYPATIAGGPLHADGILGPKQFPPTAVHGATSPNVNSPSALNSLHQHDRYHIQAEIARGGMGVILRGQDTNMRRELALKVLLPAHQNKPAVVERFLEEAHISGRLQHPGIVPVYDLGVLPDQRPYFSMKLVHGQTLAELLTARSTTNSDLTKFLGIFEQICQTVAYAHRHAVIHRDLKPSNIMVGEFGEVQVMDWGLAKTLGTGTDFVTSRSSNIPEIDPVQTEATLFESVSASGGTSGTHTQAGSVLGTPAYMPPEQARGELERVDERADVFGLGAILCEILTGKPPYVGSSAAEVLALASNGSLVPCFQRLDGCPVDDELITLAKRCLSVELDDRPRHAGVVSASITRFMESVQHRLQAAEVERAAEAARAEEALHTVSEAKAKSHAERRARLLQLSMAGVVAIVLAIGALAAVLVALQQNRLKDKAIAAEERAIQASHEEAQAKQAVELQKRRADITVADMMTARGLIAAEKSDSAEAALWFGNATREAESANDAGRVRMNRLRAQNWLRTTVTPVGNVLFPFWVDRLMFQPGGDLLLAKGSQRAALFDWRANRTISVPALADTVIAACFSFDGELLAISHIVDNDSYVGMGVQFDPKAANCQVVFVSPESGAQEAGVAPGDQITTFNGNPVQTSNDIGREIGGKFSGESVRLGIRRDNQEIVLNVVLKQIQISPEQRARRPQASRVTIWSTIQQQVVATLACDHIVDSLEFSPNSRLLAIGDTPVRLWDVIRRGYVPGEIAHTSHALYLKFSSHGERLAVSFGDRANTASHDHTVRVYSISNTELSTQSSYGPFSHTPRVASPPAFIESNNTLVTITGDNQLGFWSLTGDKPVSGQTRTMRPYALSRVISSSDQSLFVAGGNYGPEIRKSLQPADPGVHLGHTNMVRDFAFDASGNRLATVSWDQTARLWSVSDGQPLCGPLPHTGSLESVAWSDDGSLIATGQGDGLVRVWSVPTPKVTKATVRGSGRRPRLSPDGQFVAPGVWHESPSGLYPLEFTKFQVLRSDDGTPVGSMIDCQGLLFDTCICSDNQSVAALVVEGASGRLKVFDHQTGELRFAPMELPGPGISIAARNESSQVAVLCATGDGVVVDYRSGQLVYRFRAARWNLGSDHRVARLDYSPDGKYLVLIGDDFPNVLEVRDANTGELRFSPIEPGKEFGGRIRTFAISPDSTMVATGVNGNNFAQVWDIQTGKALSAPIAHPGDYYGIFCVCFSPDGQRLLTGSKDGETRYWDWRTGQPACPPMSNGDEVCAIAITPDGSVAVAAVRGATHPVHFWDLATGKRIAPNLHVSATPQAFLSGVVITPDGKRALVTAQSDALAVINLGLLLTPSSWSLEEITRQAELASGKRVTLGDVGRLLREDWLTSWNSRTPAEKESLPEPASREALHTPAKDLPLEDLITISSQDGRWRLAAETAVAQVHKPDSNRSQWARAAVLLLLAGDFDRHKQLSSEMVDRYGATSNWEEADSTCKACLLYPDHVALDSLPVTALISGLTEDPKHQAFRPWGYATLSLVRYRENRWEEALSDCQKGLELGQPNGMAAAISQLVAAMTHHQLGNTVDAHRFLRQGSLSIPAELATLGTPEYRGTLPVDEGIVYSDWLIAEVLRREAAKLITGSTDRPLDEAVLQQRAQTLLEQNDLKILRPMLLERIELDPEQAWVHELLGIVYIQSRDFDLAVESMRKAVDLNQDSDRARCYLGLLLYQQGEETEALSLLEETIHRSPQATGAYAALGQILYEMGRYADAIAQLDRGLINAPGNEFLIELKTKTLRLELLEQNLSEFVSGGTQPRDNAERQDLITLCIAKKHHSMAVRLVAEALAVDSELARLPTNGFRYNGAIQAVFAATKPGPDSPMEDAEKNRLIEQALEWLEADRALLAELIGDAPAATRSQFVSILRFWRVDRDLSTLRDADHVAKFPEPIQDRLTRFWADVEAVIADE